MVYLHLPGKQYGLETGPLFMKGLASCVGAERLEVRQAVEDGEYDRQLAKRDGYSSVRRTGSSVQGMIDKVAVNALAIADVCGDDLQLVTYTSIHDHGHRRLWQPAGYIQRITGAKNALAFSLSHGCNALAISVMQAALMLMATGGNALLVAADRFEDSGFRRWQSDQGLIYGDAGSAIVLGTGGTGFAEILYADARFLPDLEEMHRLTSPDNKPEQAWNITETKRNFIQKYGSSAFFKELEEALAGLQFRLKEWLSGIEERPRAVVTPFVGQSVSSTTYERYFHTLAEINTSDFGAAIGHTGSSDQFVGLSHLLDSGAIENGDMVILVGAGAGFSLSVLVVRINHRPSFETYSEII